MIGAAVQCATHDDAIDIKILVFAIFVFVSVSAVMVAGIRDRLPKR